MYEDNNRGKYEEENVFCLFSFSMVTGLTTHLLLLLMCALCQYSYRIGVCAEGLCRISLCIEWSEQNRCCKKGRCREVLARLVLWDRSVYSKV